jgi:MscS family membrane protein
MPVRRMLLVVVFALSSPLTSLAEVETGDEVRPTPRQAVRGFVEAVEGRRWEEAAALLSAQPLTPELLQRLTGVARDLEAVLTTQLAEELESLSDNPEGKLDDKLPSDTEEVGRVPNPGGRGTDSVRLVKLVDGRWIFSPLTVSRADDWYGALPDRWMREHLPGPLLKPGPRGIFYWQYVALTALAFVGLILGRLGAAILGWLFHRLTARTETTFDDALVTLMRRPLRLFMTTVVAEALLPSVLLSKSASDLVVGGLSGLRLISVYWALINAVELGIETARHSKFLADRPETRALLPLGSKAAKVALTVIAIIVFLQKLGYPAASLIAGLGIGGLAFALAAQKTVENLFGSVMLTLDQPFRPGDVVHFDGLTGTVESVGLRSTRIRTADRSIVTIPNGRLADLRIESLAQRDRLRLFVTLSLTQATRSEALERILVEVRTWLEQHPQRHSEAPRVVVCALGQGSIDLEVTAFFDMTDAAAFQFVKQDALLMMLRTVEKHGSALALPSRTLHVASMPALVTGNKGSEAA